MQTKLEQLQRDLSQEPDPQFTWSQEDLNGLKLKIDSESKGRFGPSASDRFLRIAEKIIGVWAPRIPQKSTHPSTIKQDIKTLQDMVGLLQALGDRSNRLTVFGRFTLNACRHVNHGFDENDGPCEAEWDIAVLEKAATEAQAILPEKFPDMDSDLFKSAIGKIRVPFASNLIIAWEGCLRIQAATTINGLFNYVLQVAYREVGLPPRKDNQEIIKAARQDINNSD